MADAEPSRRGHTLKGEPTPGEGGLRRVCLQVRGAVQGVGFRPFVHRLARDCGLSGWVCNDGHGVRIEVEGMGAPLEAFLVRLEAEAPPRAVIHGLEAVQREPRGYAAFEIRPSEGGGARTALVLPDAATCQDCVDEIFDAENRRYRYPFTNCTNCGPRFSIVEGRPYDRSTTTMKAFEMCSECLGEYRDPGDRRFHAQPNACPRCGPRLQLWAPSGDRLAVGAAALQGAVEALRCGRLVAVKGIGGFHLMTDARSEAGVMRLRRRKRRDDRPFALMYPDLEEIRRDCHVSPLEARALCSPEAPIVVLARRQDERSRPPPIAAGVAPGYPTLGVLLPYSPLHHLLLADLGFPVVATSGNVSDEPICTDEADALRRLGSVADVFLVHDRAIARPIDDSIVRVVLGREIVLRRARGLAPLPVSLGSESAPSPSAEACVLAVGAHLKNTVGVTDASGILLSQHIGDLESEPARSAFERAIADLGLLFDRRPVLIACDLHPDYPSTRHARGSGVPVRAVQHHHAHVAACMADNDLDGEVLGVAWDGTGLGPDGSVWGGEFLRVSRAEFTRVGHLRTFRLPGGDAAAREPRRAALGLLFELGGGSVDQDSQLPTLAAFDEAERRVLLQMLRRRTNAPWTSSAGRLFDVVASVTGLRQRSGHEGQAAVDVESAARRGHSCVPYAFRLQQPDGPGPYVVDWAPMIHALLEEREKGVCVPDIASRFHHTLAAIVVAMARVCDQERVVLSGGCFQNALLSELVVSRLGAAGFRAFWHQRIPPNDGGLAAGQAVVALASKGGGG